MGLDCGLKLLVAGFDSFFKTLGRGLWVVLTHTDDSASAHKLLVPRLLLRLTTTANADGHNAALPQQSPLQTGNNGIPSHGYYHQLIDTC